MGANFTPEFTTLGSKGAFRFWCQTVLPLVYDDSLSYYELLCKVVAKLNEQIEYSDKTNENVRNLYNAYIALQDYVNHYFDNLDISAEIDRKLDEMVAGGTLLVTSFKGRTGAVVPAAGDYTADLVGAVPIDGHTPMTGGLTIRRNYATLTLEQTENETGGVLTKSTHSLALSARNVAGSNANARTLTLNDSVAKTDIIEALQFTDAVDGVFNAYTVLHTGNIPKISYTGNGSETTRTIETGGLESCCMLYSTQGIAFISYWGGVVFDVGAQTIYYIPQTEATFRNGDLNLTTTNNIINGNGRTIYCKVI